VSVKKEIDFNEYSMVLRCGRGYCRRKRHGTCMATREAPLMGQEGSKGEVAAACGGAEKIFLCYVLSSHSSGPMQTTPFNLPFPKSC
jgi:hypothetical protein